MATNSQVLHPPAGPAVCKPSGETAGEGNGNTYQYVAAFAKVEPAGTTSRGHNYPAAAAAPNVFSRDDGLPPGESHDMHTKKMVWFTCVHRFD